MAKLSGVIFTTLVLPSKPIAARSSSKSAFCGVAPLHSALASWYALDLRVPSAMVNRDAAFRTRHFPHLRVFFDLITIRFLLRYLSRPLTSSARWRRQHVQRAAPS